MSSATGLVPVRVGLGGRYERKEDGGWEAFHRHVYAKGFRGSWQPMGERYEGTGVPQTVKPGKVVDATAGSRGWTVQRVDLSLRTGLRTERNLTLEEVCEELPAPGRRLARLVQAELIADLKEAIRTARRNLRRLEEQM